MAQANPQPTCCAAAPKLIFSCSGAADVGEISDRAARKLSAEGAGKMFCLAGVGGRVSGIMASTQPRQPSWPSTAARWTARRRRSKRPASRSSHTFG